MKTLWVIEALSDMDRKVTLAAIAENRHGADLAVKSVYRTVVKKIISVTNTNRTVMVVSEEPENLSGTQVSRGSEQPG